MSLGNIPGRVFLDTSIVNFWLDHGEQISEGFSTAMEVANHDLNDIIALHEIYMTGQRAGWQLAISPHTYQEVINTTDPRRRFYLENWFFEIWNYWQKIIESNDDLPSFIESERLRVKILSSGILESLPDIADRILILDAIIYNCDLFCTRDRKTIIKHRDKLVSIGIPIVNPTEWWEIIKPYAAIWW